MFNMGFTEILLLSAIALLVIGPKQLPQMARTVGRMLNEFKRATGDITSAFNDTQRKTDDFINKEVRSDKPEPESTGKEPEHESKKS
jgi:Tat protein translocase TatB subunit